MDAKTSEWRAGPNVCRCCLTEGCYKDISTEYFWMGKREVYAEMLADTLNVSISYSQSGGPNSNSRLICELCISRLRDASDFKRQVLECEKSFTQHLDAGASNILELDVTVEPADSDVKLEHVKQEKRLSDDDDDFDDRCGFDDDDDDDLDDQPLTKLATKIPKKETVDILDLLDNSKATEKRKSSTKTKAVPAKKTKSVKKEPVKAGASKVVAKTDKKKKDENPLSVARRNAATILTFATVYPFRLPETDLMCVYCCESYTDAALFRQHMKTEHDYFKVRTAFAHCAYDSYIKIDCTEMACKKCAQTFNRVEEFAHHLNEKHDEKINFDYQLGVNPFKFVQDRLMCGVCDINFPCMRQLSRHMSSHYRNFTCDCCGKSYTTNSGLQQHIRFSHIDKERICRKCRQTFSSLEAKKEHTINSPKCWMYQCYMCLQRFMTWSSKEEHLVQVHGQKKKSYSCPECSLSFTTRNKYRYHFNTTHAEINFTCPYCGRKFASKRYLEQHIVVHTGAKMFQCNVCSKAFPRKKNLAQHMWIHSEYKRFECRPCNKQFNQRVSYKSHMKGHHPEISEDQWFIG
ncbi:gastrula zinc finger protein XlCGF57.1 isoform X13 [Helicoverpa armigera]|uniref:gastrula zinc finger protein XlCGF57.1 isoform X13 n=1 Tax=Helicoverpa armigera TaxID=29058 RepID=UPI003082CE77